MYTCIHICTYVYACVHTPTHICSTYIHVCSRRKLTKPGYLVYVHMYTYMHICICICTHTYTHMQHIHTRMLMQETDRAGLPSIMNKSQIDFLLQVTILAQTQTQHSPKHIHAYRHKHNHMYRHKHRHVYMNVHMHVYKSTCSCR